LRHLCQEELQGFDEVMAYGMPTYERDGAAEIAFAGQKQYVSIYLMRSDAVRRSRNEWPGRDMGKGCLRFRRPENIGFALLRELLKATAARPGKIC
jgi:uncharacterized protein YdhG (YjbR/CyaY superfamily)